MVVKRKIGTIVSVVSGHQMSTVRIVEVKRQISHKRYKKVVKSTRRYPVYDTLNTGTGDKVLIRETKPISKTINWAVVKVIRTSK
jgi:small subunit ribosomal protein S17